jgi:hypothetical protein
MLVNLLDSAINEKNDGFKFSELSPNTVIFVKTKSSNYEITYNLSQVLIKGGILPDHTTRYPEPQEIEIIGSSWGGNMLKLDWIGTNMCLNFIEKSSGKTIITSLIQELTTEYKKL